MRGLRSTLLLALVLAGLVGYIYFVDADRPAAGIEEKDKALAGIESDSIEELRITAAGGETSRLVKGDGGWQLVEPTKSDADASELSSVTSSLAGLEVQRVVDENPTDLAQYGLEPARVNVGFRVKGDSELRQLLIGEKTPTGGDLYAKLQNEPKVFLISSFLDNTFNRTPFDLRDKSVLEFERDKVETVEVTNSGTTLQFARSGSDWKIVKPIEARGDYGAIEGLVTRLSSGQMQRIVEPEPSDLKAYGLASPAASVTVHAGSARATLALGAEAEGARYARDLARPMVFTVDQAMATDLTRGLGDYRRKDLFDFRSYNATRVEIRRQNDTLTLEKTKDAEGKEIWRNAAGTTLETTTVEDLLGKLSNLRAQAFEAGTHATMKAPEMTVTARFDGEKTESVMFGRAGSDVYATRADEPGSATVDATAYEDAIKALEAIK